MPGGVQMRQQRSEEAGTRFLERARGIWSRLQPRVDERPHEPGPDRSLMIGSIALSGVSAVTRLVLRVVGVQRAQSHRGQQAAFDEADDLARGLALDDRKRKSADRQNLVGPHFRIEGPST